MSLNKPKVSSGKVITEKSDNTLVGDTSIKYDRPVTPRRMPSDPNFGKISSVSISPSTPAISTNPVVTVEYNNSDGDARLQHATQTSGVSYGMWNQTAGTTFSVGVGGVTGSGVVKVRTVYNAKVFDQGFVNFDLSFAGNFVEFTSLPTLSGYTMGEFSSLTYNISGDEPIDVSIKWTITE